MDTDLLVSVESLDIAFPLSYDLLPSAKSKVTVKLKRMLRGDFSRRSIREFEALKSISLSAYANEVIGLIGPNGCGKTTLLRAISGIYTPNAGKVATYGEISTLLSLGTGFNNAMSGRRNIYLAGHLIGLNKEQIDERAEAIISYAGIGEHIDVPVKYYSNGMISRLGFAIATSLDPDILLIDEIFSVGDITFREKSQQTVRDLLDKARLQIIVTHNLQFVRENCTRAIFIRKGELIADGDPNDVVSEYEDWAANFSGGAHSHLGSRFVVKEGGAND